MKYPITKIIKTHGQDYIQDYRIKTKDNMIKFKRGRLKDFEFDWIVKAKGLGEVLSSMSGTFTWNDKLVIIEYSGGYAIGR